LFRLKNLKRCFPGFAYSCDLQTTNPPDIIVTKAVPYDSGLQGIKEANKTNAMKDTEKIRAKIMNLKVFILFSF